MMRVSGVLLVVFSLFCCVYVHADTYTLSLLKGYQNAVCIDGTPGGYYFKPGSGNGTSHFLIFMNGGGVCATPSDCFARAQTTLGSSKQWTSTISMGAGNGMLSNTTNNFFYNWNIAIVQYCDGGRYSSDAAQPLVYNNTKMYFRGFTIMRSVIADLLTVHNMVGAKGVVFGGCSAGGEGTYYLLDHARALIPQQIPVVGLADAGWFVDINSVYGTPSPYTKDLSIAWSMWNSSASVYPQCVQSFPQGEQWKCLYAANFYQYMKTPLFILQSQIDTMQLGAIYEFPCVNNFASCNSTEFAQLKVFSDTLSRTIAPAVKNPRDAIFLTECPTHCQGEGSSWFSTQVDGTTPAQAFANWYFNGVSEKHTDTCQYPCNKSC